MDQKHISAANIELARAKSAGTAMEVALRARNPDGFRDGWVAFLSALTRINNKLSRGAELGPAKGWFDRIKHENRTDPMLSYLVHARNANEHGLEEITREEPPRFAFGFMGRPGGGLAPFEGYGGGFELKAVVDRGVRYEVPTTHLGEPLMRQKGPHMQRLAIAYYERAISEATAFVGP